ncbi:MAG: UDP-N-acetyl-2-amino-2-deoxy-D-glucuronate oxidase [Rubricoccaceae bacterium]
MLNFALTGLAGYIAPRHLQAIRDTGHQLVAAMDIHDSVGIVDSYFPEAAFFTEFERFDRHLERLRRGPESERVNMVSVCSPNHLHDAHVRLALRIGADALCEKPLVLNPWNLDQLEELENEHGQRVWTVLQLRVHPALITLKAKIDAEPERRHHVRLTYVTSRGTWYRYSWKGDVNKSGGVPTNIGVHFFDMLQWLFGPVQNQAVHVHEPERAAGRLELPKADVQWFLSLDDNDLPNEVRGEQPTYRSITVDGEEIEFSGGFRDLHTRVYERTLNGEGFGISDARPAIELVHAIRQAIPQVGDDAHPFVSGASRQLEALSHR